MIHAGRAFAMAAEYLVGSRFRLHGRQPETGVDCVGLVTASLIRIGRAVSAPSDYGLRNLDHTRFLPALYDAGFASSLAPVAAGDVLMVQPGPAQVHLLIAGTAGGFVHAHAGLGRVVITPAPLLWPTLGVWRLRPD